MKKKVLIALVAIVGGISMIGAGCSSTDSTEEKRTQTHGEEKIKVAATIFPLYDIARTVAGDDAEAVLIIPPGGSPHYFEPSPGMLKELQGTDVIFTIGAGLDTWAGGITDNVKGATVVDMSTHVALREAAAPHLHEDGDSVHGQEDEHESHEHAHAHVHGEFDPHYWLDPTIAKEIALQIAEELVRHDEAHGAQYVQRANAFAAELAKKNAQWKTTIEGLSNKDIVTFHNAFAYFADHFGLHVVATFEPFPGKEPSPQYLVGLREEIEVHDITTLFLEPQMPKDSIEQFANDNDLAVGVLDPVGGADGRETYIDIINYNIQTIVEVNN